MTGNENVFERVLRLAAEERTARETRPLSAAMIRAAEAHKAKHREKYLHMEGGALYEPPHEMEGQA